LEKIDETHFEYDADGRTIEKRKGDQIWRFEWTTEGRLRAFVLPSGERWLYEYDAFGRRIRKNGPTETTTYVWDGGIVAEEIREKVGSLSHRSAWHFEPGTFRPIAKVENGKAYACLLDQVGTPRELITSDGKLAWSARFTAFGEVEAIRENETGCSIRFQGQWFDEESGLHYNWNRYFDPETGRYLSADPVGLLGGTRSYGYVHDPLAWIDPLGLGKCFYVDDEGTLNIFNKYPEGSAEDLALQQHVADWNEQIEASGGQMTRQPVSPEMRAQANDASDAARAADPDAYADPGMRPGHTPDVGWGGDPDGPVFPLNQRVNSYVGGGTQGVDPGTPYNNVQLFR
jgi:RHS repeat-associated protein